MGVGKLKIAKKVLLYFIIFIVFASLITLFGVFTPNDRRVIFSPPKVLEHKGVLRTYRLVEPTEKTDKPSLLIALHGLGSNSRQQGYFSMLHNSTPGDMMVVYPDAVKPTQANVKPGWNAGFCCGSGWVKDVDDVGYIESLIQHLTQDKNVDADKVYVAGFSSGGMFTHRLVAEKGELFAGFAVVSGSIGANGQSVRPGSSLPGLLIHGGQDTTVPFNGGVGATDPDFDWQSFGASADLWSAANRCRGTTNSGDDSRTVTVYENCYKPLKTIVYETNRHTWPGWRILNIWNRESVASREIISFFRSLN